MICRPYELPESTSPVSLEECAERVGRECGYNKMFIYNGRTTRGCLCIASPGCPNQLEKSTSGSNIYTLGKSIKMLTFVLN